MRADANRTPRAQRRDAFTLLEMLTVVLIIGVLASAVLGLYAQARKVTWKQQTRNMTRQLANGWKMRLQDDHAWPDQSRFDNTTVLGSDVDFPADANNMSVLNVDANGRTNTYFEVNAKQWGTGVRDYWGNFLCVRLDFDSDGKIQNPVGNQSDVQNVIYASALSYSWGPHKDKQKDWVVSY